ncbi:MAG TPA: hypothetical protein VER08_11560 [Pyrinomonadaceae bacterium]|nr:hypothetical protein [Pyrinomonadaceae bacterium]
MMKQQATTFLSVIVLILVACNARVRAQDAPVLKPEEVPAEGRKAQDFLPRGWQIGSSVEGDLNGDRLPDYALQLVPQGYDASGITAAPESHALLILLSAGGGLRRAGIATKLLVPIVPQYGLEMSLKNGVLVVNQNFGMSNVTDLTHRFRHDAASGRLLLIGKDTYSYHRPQGPEWPATRVSENYLTGVRLTTTERWLRNGKSTATTARGRASRARVFFEDVDEDPDK